MKKIFIIGMLASVIFTGCGQVNVPGNSAVIKEGEPYVTSNFKALIAPPDAVGSKRVVWDTYYNICYYEILTYKDGFLENWEGYDQHPVQAGQTGCTIPAGGEQLRFPEDFMETC